ncbi:MAG: Lrp/AsnC family transcriptional regulator [Clostridia bacterium]
MLDQTDIAIIQLLQANARLQWKEIGEQVHLTGQAVAQRIQRLTEQGIIEAFTLRVNEEKMGRPLVALITMFLKSNDHGSFQRFLQSASAVEEAHRVSGEGCYWLKARLGKQEELNDFLDQLLPFGNYRLQLSIAKIR